MAAERVVGHITAVCTSEKTGMRKKNVGEGMLIEGYGIETDAHAQSGTHRQVSLLAQESIKKMQDMGLDVHAGDLAENSTTTGVDLLGLPLGTKVRLGESATGSEADERQTKDLRDLAQGVGQLITQMRSEQQIVREWVDEQASQQAEVANVLKDLAHNLERQGS